MRSAAACYDELRDYLETVPLIDCHDHTKKLEPRYVDPAQIFLSHVPVHRLVELERPVKLSDEYMSFYVSIVK